MTEISRDELEEMGFGDLLDAQPERGFLSVIMEWYPTLPHKARQGMSLANLHDLSKQLTALNEARSEGRRAADTALSERVAELERGLEPFANVFECGCTFGPGDDTGKNDADPWFQYDGCVLTVGDMRRARALLNPSEGEAGT